MTGYQAGDRERFVGEDPAQKHADRDDFARDRARVLHSAALRRLAAKTQVLQPGQDDFSRNRLTHSLEVAQIGREFGTALGCNADVVDMACLAHDLGHPPFGHNGETALNDVSEPIGGFEGNAQTFRLLTRLEAKRSTPDGRSVGLNLTRACLDAATKYPWRRGEAAGATGKFGCYDDDAEIFDWVRSPVPTDTPQRRCVEAQVMDWSDDVAYSVHDVEDGITARLIDLRALRSRDEVDSLAALAQQIYAPELEQEQLAESLRRVVASGVVPASHTGGRRDVAELKDMTSRLIGHFVGSVELATRQRYGSGELTRFAADVVIPTPVLAECVMMKSVAARFVMLTDERLELLCTQREMIHALVQMYQDRPSRLDPMYAEDHDAAPDESAALRVVIDQVAALTDRRATMLAKEWT
ncbi:deoxyguanosinetriphosphate triphosphohydrolase [Leekyejoonella antrihumi]|uniref:Deoxyguanosinetriphosphate triphosphohydrolase n=1 Tax=Leekyejoonella antrihumi TaxID=1660198 RepID=A0A563DVQ2_9MICO|nr:deoxyguanosinetriphosphate triphosphohydrolase [Leekyejoonella antrihumi]TWP34061.1 deoxyguanosinetriphosphate triphosphohydrolase [Leekyejoonella antrihumi]